ncbi:hypothetical protein BpHYR1_006685, partial [Brachionus plicatilis]
KIENLENLKQEFVLMIAKLERKVEYFENGIQQLNTISNPENEVQIVNELFINDDGASNNATQDTNCEMQPSTSDGFLVVDQELFQVNHTKDLSENRTITETESDTNCEMQPSTSDAFLVVDQELLQANNSDDLSEKRNDTKTELELIFEKNGREIENFLKESNSLIMTYDF